MSLESIARWLGPRYVHLRKISDGVECGRIYDSDTAYVLDDAQLFHAVTLVAAERGLEPALAYRGAVGWRYSMRHDAGYAIEHGPTPLAAALAAVEELTKEDGDGR